MLLAENLAVKRSGKNNGGYFGETIHIASVMDGIRKAAQKHGWHIETLPAGSALNLLFLTRTPESPITQPRHIYISTGIHGDEPAGPLAILQLLELNVWPNDAAFWLAPCLNPTGFPLNTRESADGIDLNRDYLHRRSPEVLTHLRWLQHCPAFDVCFCLHEDWESDGFYLYELNPDSQPSLAPPWRPWWRSAPLCCRRWSKRAIPSNLAQV